MIELSFVAPCLFLLLKKYSADKDELLFQNIKNGLRGLNTLPFIWQFLDTSTGIILGLPYLVRPVCPNINSCPAE